MEFRIGGAEHVPKISIKKFGYLGNSEIINSTGRSAQTSTKNEVQKIVKILIWNGVLGT